MKIKKIMNRVDLMQGYLTSR